MKKVVVTILSSVLIVCSVASCTGINLQNNCSRNVKQIVTVLPFLNDEYDCYKNVEKILQEMCYQTIDGRVLLNEYSTLTSKKFEEILFEEFCEFADSRGVSLIIYGEAKIVWIEPANIYTPTNYSRSSGGGSVVYARTQYDDLEMKQIVRGNYASINCFGYNTKTKETTKIFENYKVKKISLGQPDFIGNSASN